MTVGELADEYGAAGVGAADLHEAVDVTESRFDDDVTLFFGLAGAMVPTGMRAIVADLIRDGYIDVLVTTGANLTHDAIEVIGGKHHHGAVHAEGKTEREHDETLRDEGVDRIYNVYLPVQQTCFYISGMDAREAARLVSATIAVGLFFAGPGVTVYFLVVRSLTDHSVLEVVFNIFLFENIGSKYRLGQLAGGVVFAIQIMVLNRWANS
ncbi:deoxyhypusine synthase [Natrinema altunense JCM 12890]|uniref:Deoxyhypusine synthase n=1 Tax=Natrinema altunense (strain JCM 12890 / CGMCC 1.3731 / AJ2) TaxID=1227494 RepID=L9ZB48_NATA2|nr:deoxyhypusine synthase family protein [Natrinema altunense]ELY83705.1 deoxyhypusine synthase [Natrinema altunense JCM 12890]